MYYFLKEKAEETCFNIINNALLVKSQLIEYIYKFSIQCILSQSLLLCLGAKCVCVCLFSYLTNWCLEPSVSCSQMWTERICNSENQVIQLLYQWLAPTVPHGNLPIFCGNWERWCIQMKVIFEFQDVLDMVSGTLKLETHSHQHPQQSLPSPPNLSPSSYILHIEGTLGASTPPKFDP